MERIGRVCNKLYRRLGITRSASKKVIKDAYYDMAKETHPDHGGAVGDFVKVKEAYSVLSDPSSKRHYDQTGEWIAIGVSMESRIEQRSNAILAVEFLAVLKEVKGEVLNVDLICKLENRILDNIRNISNKLKDAYESIEVGEKALALLEYSGGSSANPLEGVFLAISSENEKVKTTLIEEMVSHEDALKIIKKYVFNFTDKGISVYQQFGNFGPSTAAG